MPKAADIPTENGLALEQRLADLTRENRALRTELARTQAELETILNCRSWRVASWMRVIYPPNVANAMLRRMRGRMLKNPATLNPVVRRLKKFPRLWEWTKRVFLFSDSDSAGYTTFRYQDTLIHFSMAPLADQRGIGRVSRELLKALSGQLETVDPGNRSLQGSRAVYFYPSVHWCPPVLPTPSVVMVHDVIPLLFPEQFPEAIIHEWKGRHASAIGRAQHIVTISQSNVDHIHEQLGVAPDDISVIYNGVAPLPVAPSADVVLPLQPYLTYLGSHDRHKNIEVVFRALQDPRLGSVHLVMIGDNKECASHARHLGIGDRVHFLGKLEDATIGSVLTRSRGLVFPSLFEGFGLPPLEAALLGVPVICSDRPAMNELIPAGTLLCDPQDPAAWAQAMLCLVHDGQPIEITNRLREHVRKNYTWERAAQRLIQILSSQAQ